MQLLPFVADGSTQRRSLDGILDDRIRDDDQLVLASNSKEFE